MESKLTSHLKDVIDSYGESVEIIEGLTFSQKETLKTIEYYTSSKYLSGNKDSLGREKPFYEINNFRVRVAKTATDIDVKDIRVEADKPKFYVQAMLLNSELYKWMKESNFSLTLNNMGHTRPKYGGVLVKKTEEDGLKIEVVDWKNAVTDQTDITSLVVETHYMTPSEMYKKKDVWENVDEVLEQFKKHCKGKTGTRKITVYELVGDMPSEYFEEDEDGYERYRCFIAEIGNKKYKLFSNVQTKEQYKYLEWEKVPGRGLGRGIVEEGFESQVWTNDSMIAMKDVMTLAGKIVLFTDSQKINSGNVITDIESGHVFQGNKGDTLQSVNLMPSALPQMENMINLWKDQYDRVASTFDANTGEQPPSGTPLGQTQILNSVANSPFEYQREVWGIFVNEIINDWVFPYLIKKLKKGHTLVADFDEEELKIIDDSFSLHQANKKYVDKILNGERVFMDEYLSSIEAYKGVQQSLGRRRYIEIPDGFFDDFKGKVTINITGEMKNKQAVLQSLSSILTIVASNPAVLQDPTLYKIFGTIVEMSGVPISPTQLKTSAPSEQTQMAGSMGGQQLSQVTQPNGAPQTV
jgi:hypothetical protein